jgi:nucleoid DNA-binding protein
MNKEELIRAVHQQSNAKYTIKDLSEIFDALLNVMSDALSKGEDIQLSDFGTFSLEDKTLKSLIRRK